MPVNKSGASSPIPATHSQPEPSRGKKAVSAKSSSGRKIRKLGKALKKLASTSFGKADKQRKKSLQDYSPKSTDNIFVLEPTIDRLEKADNRDRMKAILAEDVHSIENLYVLSRRLPDEVFNRMKDVFFDRLCTLEAKNHVEHMINNCRDDKGKLDATKLPRLLAQHQEFTSKTHSNLFFADSANYVKSRLTMPGMGRKPGMGPCELLCHIRGCSPEDFRLPPAVILDSGASSELKKAEYLGGYELKAARKSAAEMVEKQLEADSPEVLEHLQVQFQASNDICRNMEQLLREKLEPGDREPLCEQMATLRANSCMEDITLKVKSFGQLSQRLDNMAARYNTPGTTPVQLIGGLIGEKNLQSDARLLGRVMIGEESVPDHVRDQAEDNLGAGVARQLASKLSDKIGEMVANEGITDAGRVENAMRLVHALRQAADSMDEV